jgi:hypothetical protein
METVLIRLKSDLQLLGRFLGYLIESIAVGEEVKNIMR